MGTGRRREIWIWRRPLSVPRWAPGKVTSCGYFTDVELLAGAEPGAMGPAPTWSLCADPPATAADLGHLADRLVLAPARCVGDSSAVLGRMAFFNVDVLTFRSFTSGVFAVWFAGSSSMMFLPYGRPAGCATRPRSTYKEAATPPEA
jgi:hypothetical protein